jgi:hypothetical protein
MLARKIFNLGFYNPNTYTNGYIFLQKKTFNEDKTIKRL